MQVAKEKMKDMTSKAKEKMEVQKVKAEEKAEKKAAGTREEKEIAHEFSKARQAEAKMEYHLERAEHRAETLTHRAAGANHVSSNAALTAGGIGGAFHNGHGQPVGGVPVRPGGGAVDAVRPPGTVDAASTYGGVPARPPGGAVYPPAAGMDNGASTYGAGGGKTNDYI
ncbi:hypothetical protein MA16_Dca015803 [Dendrobium catenatum]|uniref:18 kDa seed maturation protein n=1 Tax=Dendrobium catenatum TaxID=906689 RepID=A0A2I0WS71_9ASPA|nr:hypothetical protein MA16_Dca015803 [Dendrobium catenatum]